MELIGYLIVLGALGLAFGSFANVVIWRFPRSESLSTPPSHCPSCEHPIRWRDNIPVVSWVLLRARCRDCGAPIAARYPLVELLGGMLFVAAGFRWGLTLSAALGAAFFYLLMILTFIDLDTMRLPNPLVALLAGVGAVGTIASVALGSRVGPLTSSPHATVGSFAVAAIAGAVLGGGVSLLIASAYSAVRKAQGFGMGDVKLLFVMGLFLGPYVLLAFFLGSLIGSVTQVVALRRRGEGMRAKFAFGPYLAIGGIITALAGNRLVEWYVSVLGIT